MQCSMNNNGSYELAINLINLMVNSNHESLIDLCCCHAEITGCLGFAARKYIDILPRQLRRQEEQQHYIQADILGDHKVFNQHWQVSTCLDGIEHVTKEQGYQLRDRMMHISDICIIFTPADAWMMEAIGSDRYYNDPESHKSLWSPDDFPGWSSIVFPKWHESLGIGAFWSWHNKNVDMEQDFVRVVGELQCQTPH